MVMARSLPRAYPGGVSDYTIQIYPLWVYMSKCWWWGAWAQRRTYRDFWPESPVFPLQAPHKQQAAPGMAGMLRLQKACITAFPMDTLRGYPCERKSMNPPNRMAAS